MMAKRFVGFVPVCAIEMLDALLDHPAALVESEL